MSAPTFFVSEAAVRNFKHMAQRRLAGVSSSHMSEAIAAGLGFKTHAALRAALAGRPTVEVQKPSNPEIARRLRQLGYSAIPDDLHLVPALDQSYSPFKKFPLRKKRGVRWTGWRNLMVSAINAGLEQRLFGLSPDEDWWPGAAPEHNGGETGHYRFTFDGDMEAIASLAAIGSAELSIHVLLEPRRADIEADHCGGIADGSAFAHGWLERRLGAWLMDGGEDFECKRAMQARIAQTQIVPLGYADLGSFLM